MTTPRSPTGETGASYGSAGVELEGCSALDDGEHVAGGEHEVLLAGVLDLGAAVLAVEDLVADLHVERHAGAVLEATRADGQDGALLGLLLGRVGDDQTGRGGALGVARLD